MKHTYEDLAQASYNRETTFLAQVVGDELPNNLIKFCHVNAYSKDYCSLFNQSRVHVYISMSIAMC